MMDTITEEQRRCVWGSRRRPGLRLGPAVAVVALALCSTHVRGESMIADVVDVPVDRVVRNIEQLLAKTPDDVQLRLNLARAHMIAYAQKTATVQVNRGRDTDGPAVGWLQHNVLPAPVPATDSSQLKRSQEHLALALAQYERVIAIAPDNPTARLGYAWALQQSGATNKAIDAYRETVRIAWPVERDRARLMGSRSVTEEAARYLIPLLDPARDKAEVSSLRAQMAQLERMARAITPIAVPLRDGLAAPDLVNDGARVPFDLDGSGFRRPWTWLSADAAWLVMDGQRRGVIRSGLQLFGNVTFWLFWDNGYAALGSLDDSGDGVLTGRELDGLALWHDANADGISDLGEVRPLAAWQIVAVSCAHRIDATHPDEIAFSPEGVRFADGHVRPTYDVVLRPVAPGEARVPNVP